MGDVRFQSTGRAILSWGLLDRPGSHYSTYNIQLKCGIINVMNSYMGIDLVLFGGPHVKNWLLILFIPVAMSMFPL